MGRDADVLLSGDDGERVTELYAQALERYGNVDGELLAARLIAERAWVDFTAGPRTAGGVHPARPHRGRSSS